MLQTQTPGFSVSNFRQLIALFGIAITAAMGCLVSEPVIAQETKSETRIDFNRDIKPLLSDRCFHCHGPDEKQRQADLRLDLSEPALDSAIVAGDAKTSELMARILSDDPDTVMPPPGANKKALSKNEIEKFRLWIEQGAKYQTHWAYEKPVKPTIPKLSQLAKWAKSDIDKLIAKRLEEHKRTPVAPADKRTLIRRLYFDLIGLPPSQADVAKFVADTDPQAYEKVVDKLLASNAFGERMAVFWLDQVRYADTNGIHGDNHRDHSLFRDYVIDAFNQNMPFDTFTIEQLAGDLLPDGGVRQLIASGYNRLNMTTREGGAQAKEYRAKYAADRVRNASTVWMGSTLGCAECHNHKYDPFKSKDFYRFAAFFSDIEETAVGQQQSVKLPSPKQQNDLERVTAALKAAQAGLETRSDARQAAFERFIAAESENIKNLKPAWQVASPTSQKSSGGATLVAKDGVVTSTGKNPDKDNYTLTYNVGTLAGNKKNGKPITGFKLDVLKDDSFGNKSVARGNGNIVLTDVKILYDGKPLKIKTAIADFSQPNHDVKLAIDNNKATGWAVSGHTKSENRAAVFVLDKPLSVAGKKAVTIQLFHESIYPKHNIGKFKIGFTTAQAPSLSGSSKYSAEVMSLLAKGEKSRSKADADRLYRFFLQFSDAVKNERMLVDQLKKQKAGLENSFRSILVTKRIKPRMTRVLPRGNWLDDSGDVVQPGVPSFLSQIENGKESANRLDLAKWFVDPANPLTARVFVNRLWKIAFGEGLVRTPDDFGSQGSVPTHPELLDHLAIEFVESGWDVKKTLKSIVMTKTYRLSSKPTAEDVRDDPANHLLSRQNRFRLDAEFVRDNAMRVSGLLVEQIGGDSVKPYQPAGYWRHLNFPRRTYQPNKDQNQYRRGLYTYWCRTFLHPSLSVFDAPSREESCVQRPRSNTPLQALVLLNDPTYVEAAQVFAEQVVRSGGKTVEERIRFAFQNTLNRDPAPREVEILSQVAKKHLAEFAEDKAAASEAIKTGNRVPSNDLDPVELAAWTSVTRILLNLNESITRY